MEENKITNDEESINRRRETVLSQEIIDKMVDQLVLYLQSSNLYRTLGLLAKDLGLLGCGEYLFIQRKERSHSSTELHEFLDAAGARFVIPEIPESEGLDSLTDIKSIFDMALDNEIKITDSLNNLATIACETWQHTALIYLHKELEFQLGEESEARDRVAIVKASGDDPMDADIKITTLIKKRKK